ncbi:MATE efflux family protein [Oopsacas minuta]|uniref:MATE efflux family protein n=1 Tax=Oopsacas minuta TaxID=111878 RepID=A0AAV7JPN3_9METZ|nr:MATE efflux family protein [Oopsacas minuta]
MFYALRCMEQNNTKQIGHYFYRALFMSALTCIPVFTILISIRPIVYLVFQDWELAEYSGSYTDILCFGYPAYLYNKIGIRFLQALNIVWGPVLYLLIGITLNGKI